MKTSKSFVMIQPISLLREIFLKKKRKNIWKTNAIFKTFYSLF